MKKECTEFPGVSLLHERIRESLQSVCKLNCHMLMLHPDAENNLIAEVILFMEPALSLVFWFQMMQNSFIIQRRLWSI